MGTTTISTRLDEQEARQLADLAQAADLDRATFLKQMLRRGVGEFRIEQACAAYRRGDVTLSRAAELSGVNLYDLLRRLPDLSVTLNYDLDALGSDVRQVADL
jgi:predicted HTH domain antitoxin